MQWLSILFVASLLLGQLGGISVSPGVVVYVHDIILVLFLCESFVQYALRGSVRTPKLGKQILLFIAAAIVSLLTNSGRFLVSELGVGALYLVRWTVYSLVYVVVLQRFTKKDLWTHMLYGIGVGVGLVGLGQFFLYPDLRNLSYLGWDPHYYRLFSTFLDPNYVGIFLTLTFFLGLSLWVNHSHRVWIGIGQLVTVLSLLLTYSRSSYLAFVVGIGVYALVKKQWAFIAAGILFVCVVFWLPRTSGSTLSLFRVDSTVARIGNWQEGLALVAQSPVFGHGFNTLRYARPEQKSGFSKAAAGLDSSVLFLGATTGILGILAYGYLLIAMVRLGKKDPWYLACLAALTVHSIFVNSLFYPWVLLWLWIASGIVERVNGDR